MAVLITGTQYSPVADSLIKSEDSLQNERYKLVRQPDQTIDVCVDGLPAQRLSGDFVVMYSPIHLGYQINRVGEFNYSYPDPFPGIYRLARRWTEYTPDLAALVPELPSIDVHRGGELMATNHKTGREHWVYMDSNGDVLQQLTESKVPQTYNPFLAGVRTDMQANRSSIEDRTIRWEFPDHPDFTLTAEVYLPEGRGDPEIQYNMRIKTDGYYSVAYLGAPSTATSEIIPIPQLVTGGCNQRNILVSEAHIAWPGAHVGTGTLQSVLVVDPKESPFRLLRDSAGVWTYSLSSESNSRFGLMVWEEEGWARPVAFTPIMAGHESRMLRGDSYEFALRYVLRSGTWEDTYRYVARQIYDFRDMRDNSGAGSMNQTIENIMDYLSDRSGDNFAMWHAEQKYYNYWSDKAGNFKPFSPMFTLAAAIITDDETFYRERTLPIIEYALSRENNCFQPYDVVETQMAHWGDNGIGMPYPNAVQLTSLHDFFQGRSYVFKHYAEAKGFDDNNFMHVLARYHLHKNPEDLLRATEMATRGGNFSDLLDIYEEAPLENILNLLVSQSYRYLYKYNLFPRVPDVMVTIDKGGQAPIHGHAYQRHRDWGFPPPLSVTVPEQEVPAWRASVVGTQWEIYRGGQWPWAHGQFMRIATYADDEFMRDMQRWAMIGRYANWVGDFRSIQHSLIAEMEDAPNRHIYETTFSTMNPGHAVEWIGAFFDFLVSDCFNRSRKQIDFPSQSMHGSSFRVKVYGDRTGRFYDEKNVRLWLPRQLLKADNVQVDYLAGYGNGKLYLAFWNQSFSKEKVEIVLNPKWIDYQEKHTARQWVDNIERGESAVVENGILRFCISRKGIIAFAINDISVKTVLHSRIFDGMTIILDEKSVAVNIDTPFGKVHAMLITIGKGLTTSYIYTDALPADVISAMLHYRQGDGLWQTLTDSIYPYEFSVEIDEEAGDFQFVFEIENALQEKQRSEQISLQYSKGGSK